MDQPLIVAHTQHLGTRSQSLPLCTSTHASHANNLLCTLTTTTHIDSHCAYITLNAFRLRRCYRLRPCAQRLPRTHTCCYPPVTPASLCSNCKARLFCFEGPSLFLLRKVKGIQLNSTSRKHFLPQESKTHTHPQAHR